MLLSFFLPLLTFVLVCVFPAFNQLPAWSPTNGPFGGDMRAVAISPEGDFFAVARHWQARSRLYRSIDHGVSYQELTAGDSINFLGPIYCGNGGLILCGATSTSGIGGIARSTDYGTSWTVVPPLLNVMSFNRDSAGNILCGGDAGMLGTADPGIYCSTDKGESWESRNGDLSVAAIASAAYGPGPSLFLCDEGYYGTDAGVFRSTDDGAHWVNVLPAVTVDMTVVTSTPQGSILVGTGGNGVLRSTDNGAHWTTVMQNGLNVHVTTISIDSSGGILMGTSSGIDRSTDDGATWTPSSTGLSNLAIESIASGPQGLRLVGNAVSVSESADGGNTWFDAARGIRSSLCAAIASSPQGTLIAATDASGGVYRSGDGGDSWIPIGGNLSYRQVYALASSGGGTFFACVQGDSDGEAVFRSTDQGVTWQGLSTMMPKLPALGIATRGEKEVVVVSNAGNAATGVFRSTDDGSTWNALTTGYTNLTFWSVVLPPDGKILAGYYGGVAVSADTGRSWHSIDYGLPYAEVKSLASDAGARVYAATDGFGVFYLTSDIAGPGWAPADTNLPRTDAGSVSTLATDSAGNVFGASSMDGLWRINPPRLLWTRVAAGLTDTAITGVCFTHSRGAFVTTRGEGVFAAGRLSSLYTITDFNAVREGPLSVKITWSSSNDASLHVFEAQRWSALTPGFVPIPNGVLAAGEDGMTTHEYVFTDTSATSGEERYRLRLIGKDGSEHFSDTVSVGPTSAVSIDPAPLSTALQQNYPNPFNPTTTIRYTIAGTRAQGTGTRSVQLVVYDALGQEVVVLVKGMQFAGTYEVKFDGSKLASGVYFLRLTTGLFAATRSMILLK